MTAIKIAVLVATVAGGYFTGHMLGKVEPASSGLEQSQGASTKDIRKTDYSGGKPAPAEARTAAAPSRSLASIKPAQAGSYEALVNAHGLTQKSQELARAFSDNEAGQKLSRMATLLSFGPAPKTPEGALVADQVEWLKAHPNDAFHGIAEGLAKVPAEYAQERQYLIQFAARLDVDDRMKFGFLGGQLERSAESTEGYDGAAALSALLEVDHNSDDVEGMLRTVLEKQHDAKSREMLLSLYSAREPERSQKLKNELGIDGN
jgi:hypothetical protein